MGHNRTTYNVTLGDVLGKKVEEQAAYLGVSITALVKIVLTEWLTQRKGIGVKK